MNGNLKKVTPILAIIALYLGTVGGGGVGPIVFKLSEAYPDVPMVTIRLVSTLPAAVNCILGLVVAAAVGKRFKYSTVLRVGVVCFLIGAVLPAFWNQKFIYILIARFIFGIGMGCTACKDVVMAKLFPGPESAKFLGYGAAITTGGSTIVGLIAGVLGDMNWKYVFYIGFIILLPVAIMFTRDFNPEEEKAEEVKEGGAPKKKGKIRPIIFFYFFRLIMINLCSYPFLGFISVFVAERGLGGATQSSWCSSAYTLGFTCANMLFGFCYNKLGRIWYGLACCIGAVSFVFVLAAQGSVALVMVGGFLLGIGFSGCMMTSIKYAQVAAYKETMAISSTLLALAVSLGSFCSSYWMILSQKIGQIIPVFETEMEKTFLIGIFIFLAFGIHALVKDPRPTPPAEEAEGNV